MGGWSWREVMVTKEQSMSFLALGIVRKRCNIGLDLGKASGNLVGKKLVQGKGKLLSEIVGFCFCFQHQ